MKYAPGLARLALLIAFAGVFVALPVRADDQPKLIATKDIAAMTPRTATFTKRLDDYSGSFTSADGGQFVLGDIRGEQAVWHIVGALKEGQSYKFPDVVTRYLAGPHYQSAKEIAAMPACTATIASRSPCSSHFVTPEGKWFSIGDPGSGAEISHFIWSMKDGQTGKFPEVFLNFQAAPHFSTAQEIAAMEPRTGTLTGEFNGFCYFTATDGKGFFIGPEALGRAVNRFLLTLEESRTYKFPDVFLEYQKGQ